MTVCGAAYVDQELDPVQRGGGHECRCLSCAPDMVPDFSRDDARFHDGAKCGHQASHWSAMRIDGAPVDGYTSGWFEGAEGWVLISSTTMDVNAVHICACGERARVTPRFGHVVYQGQDGC